MSELQASRKQFPDSIAGLSTAQWSYKAGPDRWSIAEVSEHIVAAEGYIGGMMTSYVLKSKPDAAKAARDKTVAFVKDTHEALRDHFFEPLPGSELDGVQGFLFLCGHNERHVEQIEEVKRSPGYPKN